MYIFKAAVVGAGAMGAEIAQVISWSGLPVVLKDVDQAMLDRGMERIRGIYQRRVDRGRMTRDEMEQKMALITPTLTYDGFGDVDLVVEAVPEKMDLKKRVFAELDRATPSTAILASNTSALSITEMAAATSRPQRVVGLHFFYPAAVMKLVEVIAGRETSEETLDTAVEFVESLRKLPVRVKECPGFLVNRILLAAMMQVIHFQHETGAPYEEVDAVVKEKAGAPMGPFTLADTLGLDVVLDVCKTLETLGPRFAAPAHFENMIKEGKLGVKSGQGFYTYTK
ncbi:MAG: 3-hydroxyacyl-CoA dehydrogenase family protein [Firmicutes bacterium]|nr:3-hydroxyacyl-CoA dehydrogenase family protein [Bacillota bacterium]